MKARLELISVVTAMLAMCWPAVLGAAVLETIPVPLVSSSVGTIASFPGWAAGPASGQTFTVGVAGVITSIAVSPNVNTLPTPAATLVIHSGAGFGGPLLHSEPVSFSGYGCCTLRTFTLSTPVPVTPGVYTFGMTDNPNIILWGSTNQYTGGIQYGFSGSILYDLFFQVVIEEPPGSIDLVKQTDPNDPNTIFTFDVSSIDPNDPNEALGDDDVASFLDVEPGTYRVSELVPAGWELENVSCEVDTGNNDSFDPNDPNDPDGFDIVVNAGQAVTCTFNNRRYRADLTVIKDATPLRVAAGEYVTYTITVTNNGPDAADGVVLTDVLAEGLMLDSVMPSQGSCSEVGGTLTCDLGTLENLDVATVVLVVETQMIGDVENSVTVTTDSLDADGAAGAAPAVFSAGSDIPALDEWALMLLTLVLAMAGFVAVRR